jgi:hypothetical protein
MKKIKVKIGMVDLLKPNTKNVKLTILALVEKEIENQYFVRWGRYINGDSGVPLFNIITKDKLYNVQEREYTKFQLWVYKNITNNFC